MSQVTSIVINIILDGQNYREWAFCVQTALRGHGLTFNLTDDAPEPAANNTMLLKLKLGKLMMGSDGSHGQQCRAIHDYESFLI